jgi:excisionase family DNA binding protein
MVNLRSISFAAQVLGVSVFTVRRLIAAELIKAVRVGARVLIADTELERIAAQGVTSASRVSKKRLLVNLADASESKREAGEEISRVNR